MDDQATSVNLVNGLGLPCLPGDLEPEDVSGEELNADLSEVGDSLVGVSGRPGKRALGSSSLSREIVSADVRLWRYILIGA